jgi:multiple sugar transport system substrate-binding protein
MLLKRSLIGLALLLLVTGLTVAQDIGGETGPRVLTFFTTEADPPQLAALGEIIDAYNEMNPDVFIDVVTGTPSTRGNRTRVLVTSGVDAGIFELEPSFARDWAANGFLLPLDDVVEEIGGQDEYVPGSLFTFEDSVYGLPYATSVYGLWYREDLFEEAGLEPPTTYEELVEVAAALTNEDEGVYGLSLPGATNSSVSFFSVMLWQNCLDYYTPSGDLTFDDPAALEVVQAWTDLAQYAPPGFENWSWGDQITAFITGRAAMSIYAGRLGARMPDQAPQLLDLSGLTRIPLTFSENEASPYVTYGAWSRIAISANTPYPETAKDFLRFFLSGQQLANYNATVPGHLVPPLPEVAELINQIDNDYTRNYSEWLDFFNRDAAFINHPANNMGSVAGCTYEPQFGGPPWGGPIFSTGGVIDNMLQQVFLGVSSPEDAWNNAVTEMERIKADWLEENPDWEPPV